MRDPVIIALSIGAILIAVLSVAVFVSNYKECRAHGFSVVYCATRR